MSAYFSNLIYDPCALAQRLKESTGPMQYRLYLGAFENCNNICAVPGNFPENPIPFVDVESELTGRTRIQSLCPGANYPFCNGGNCITTDDKRIPPFIPYMACDRDITPTNMRKLNNPGYVLPNADYCTNVNSPSIANNYYSKF
jgi:hypothetical protein